MPVFDDLKERICSEIENIRPNAIEIADYIFDNPELGGKEFKALKILTRELESNGFLVEIGSGKLNTAFKATFNFSKPGPVIAFIAEYDALPGIGHACHHHLIASASVNTAISLSRLKEDLCGSIVVVGTPAEEIMDAKKIMEKNGVFNGIDAALMFHGGSRNSTNLIVLAIECLEFKYKGKAAHAAAAPDEGINALDAVIMLFNSINALRQQFCDDVRIHGIINNGGNAVNIIPENASARFYIRSKNRKYLEEVIKKVKNCARGAALQTGAKLKISKFEASGNNLLRNLNLCMEFEKNLINLGVEIDNEIFLFGSSDIGNLSFILPVLHPIVRTSEPGIALHTIEFRDCGKDEIAYNGMILGMKATALTAIRILLDNCYLKSIKKEFDESKKKDLDKLN